MENENKEQEQGEKQKSPQEASEQFHKIMKASVGGRKRQLYLVTFDSNNNPIDAKIASPMSNGGHGLANWDKKTLFTISVYVEAMNKAQAIQKAKEIADKRVERGSE